ncbi:MAG: hypothetical protein V4439_02280 [Patescibacteria group bacterium]
MISEERKEAISELAKAELARRDKQNSNDFHRSQLDAQTALAKLVNQEEKDFYQEQLCSQRTPDGC